MMPHLGVLSTVHPKAALEIFEKDCLVPLGTCVAPRGVVERGKELFNIELTMPDGSVKRESLNMGEIRLVKLGPELEVEARITPREKCDVGAGPGHSLTTKIRGGAAGIILDARGRPLQLPSDRAEMKKTLTNWLDSLGMYTEDET
jgi:hypothetical protein